MSKRTIVFLEGCEPDGLTAQKINVLGRLAGCEVHLVYWARIGSAISMPFQVDLPAAQVHRIGVEARTGYAGTLASRWNVARQVRRILRRLKPDVLQVATFDLLVSALLPRRLARNIVFDLRDTEDWMLRRPVLPVLRHLLRQVQLIMVTSPRYETDFIRHYRLAPPDMPVTWVPNVPDSAVFSGYRPHEARDGLTLGYIGSFRGEKSLRLFAAGLAEARRRGVEVRGLFAGTGLELPLVKQLCARHDFLSYVGPYAYLADIRRLFEQVDVMYAIYDDSHNKRIHLACRLAEAIVCGIPTLVLEKTYMAEIVQESGVGLILPQARAELLADVLCRLVAEPDLRGQIGEKCRKVARVYTFDHYRETFLHAYGRFGFHAHN